MRLTFDVRAVVGAGQAPHHRDAFCGFRRERVDHLAGVFLADLITLKNRTLSPLAQLLIEAAREIAKPLAKRV
jgi:hypothetical protein